MTPEERSLLESTHELAKENNALLRNLKNRARLSTAVKVTYWLIIIGLSFGAFYFIQPYVDMIKGLTGGSSGVQNTQNTQNPSFSQQIQDLIK